MPFVVPKWVVSMVPNRPATASEVPEEMTGQPRRVLVGGVILRRTFAALQFRNFRLFFVGQMLSLMGTWMQNTALSWLVYQMTGSKFLLGLVQAAGTAPMLFLSIYGGSVADRYPKRRIILGTQCWMMLIAFLLASLTAAGSITPVLIVVLSGLSGVAMAFDMPARQSFLLEITSRGHLLNAISLNSAIVNSARVAGPAIAGLIMARWSPAVCFFANALSFIAVISGLLMMKLEPGRAPVRKDRGHIREGFRYVLGNRRLKIVFALFAIVGVFGWSYSVLLPPYATDFLGLQESGYGLLLTANGVGALTGALTTAAFGSYFKPRHLAFTGLYLFSSMLFLLAMFQKFALALVCLAFAGWGMMLFFSTINTVIQTSVPDHMRGRIMGIWALLFGGMMPLGSLQAGTLSHYFGVLPTVFIGASVCGLAGLVTHWFVRNMPAQSAAPSVEEATP